MAHFLQIYPTQRAPRVKLAGSVMALIQLENRKQVRAKLHQISIHGGLLQLTEPLEEQLPVEVLFHVGSTTVRARAETIFPMWATHGYLQPFRFTDLREEERQSLESDLQRLLNKAALSLEPPMLENDAVADATESVDSPLVFEDESVSNESIWEQPAYESAAIPVTMESTQVQPESASETMPALDDDTVLAPMESFESQPALESEAASDEPNVETPAYESEAAVATEPTQVEQEPVSEAISLVMETTDIQEVPQSETLYAPIEPSEVVLYFDRPEDALRFTAAASSVISSDGPTITRDDLVRLGREVTKISRVTSKGVFKTANFRADEEAFRPWPTAT